MARIIIVENPLRPLDYREEFWDGLYCADDGSGWLNKAYPDGFPGTHRTFINRAFVEVKDYDAHLGADDEVILMIAPGAPVVAGAIAIGQAIAASQVLTAIAIAVVSTAVSYALASTTDIPDTPASLSAPKADSIYSLSVPTNRARLGAAIPVPYGRNRIVPDFASQPYSVFESNDQYVYLMMCLGQGPEFTLHETYFADTPLSQLQQGVAQQWYCPPSVHLRSAGPINALTGMYENVYTSPEVADQELVPPKSYSAKGTLLAGNILEFDANKGDRDELDAGLQLTLNGNNVVTIDHVIHADRVSIVEDLSALLPTEYVNYDTVVDAGAAAWRIRYKDWTWVAPEGYKSIQAGDAIELKYETRFGVTGRISATITLADAVGFDLAAIAQISGTPLTASGSPYDMRKTTIISQLGFGKIVTATWDSVKHKIGPFTTSPPGKTIGHIEVDLQWPGGLYESQQETGAFLLRHIDCTVTFTEIDDAGVPTGTPDIVHTFAHEAATNTPQRKSYGWGVPVGRYQVQVTRTTKEEDDTRFVDRTLWTGLKSHIVFTGSNFYGDVALLVLKVKATNGLSSDVLSRISVDCTRHLNGVPETGAQAAFEDILTNTTYGAARPASEIVGAMAGDFNAVVDFDTTVWEMLEVIAKSVQARVLPRGSQFVISQGDPTKSPKMKFVEGTTGGGLITDGSLVANYALGDRVEEDGIEIEYRDPVTFQPAYALYPSRSVRPREIKLLGCTDATIAMARAKRVWNEMQYKRFHWSFQTELDALVLEPGDTITITPLDKPAITCVVAEIEPTSEGSTNVKAYEYDARVYA